MNSSKTIFPNHSATYRLEFCNSSAGSTPGKCAHLAGATILSPCLMFLAGVLGNIFALYTLYRTKTDVRSTKFYTLVAGLAWTDLIGILMTSPSTLAAYINGRKWVGGDAHCNYHGFAMTCFGLATPLIICAMAVERFMALKCVFFYSSRCRNGTARGVMCVLWITVVLFALLPLFGFGRFEKQYPGTWCFLDFHSTRATYNVCGYMYASVNLLLIVVMVICNGYVVVTLIQANFLRKSNQNVRHASMTAEGGSRRRPSKDPNGHIEVQMIVLMVSITTVFVVCWAPLMIQIIVTMATRKINFLMDLAAVRLASFNQTLDPWLYILLRRSLIRDIKKAGKFVFTKCCPTTGRNTSSGEGYAPVADGKGVCVCQRQVAMNDMDIGNGIHNDSMSLPDVMKGGANEKSNNKLPDVTDASFHVDANGQYSKYVCRIEKRNRQTIRGMPDNGIYVKFFFVSKSKDDSHSQVQHQRTVENPTDASANLNSVEQAATSVSVEKPVTVSSDLSKDTSLPNDSSDDTIHSEAFLNIHQEPKHKSVRRTKSET